MSVVRPIAVHELVDAVSADDEMSIDVTSALVSCRWSRGDDTMDVFLDMGVLYTTSPPTAGFEVLGRLAGRVDAQVMLEEPTLAASPRDAPPPPRLLGCATWIGWSVVSLLLAVLLAWQW